MYQISCLPESWKQPSIFNECVSFPFSAVTVPDLSIKCMPWWHSFD